MVGTHYDTLGVGQQANQEEIARAYKRLALRHHPDKSGCDDAAGDAFRAIAQAYRTLKDPELRRLYDLRCGVAPVNGKVRSSWDLSSKAGACAPAVPSPLAPKTVAFNEDAEPRPPARSTVRMYSAPTAPLAAPGFQASSAGAEAWSFVPQRPFSASAPSAAPTAPACARATLPARLGPKRLSGARGHTGPQQAVPHWSLTAPVTPPQGMQSFARASQPLRMPLHVLSPAGAPPCASLLSPRAAGGGYASPVAAGFRNLKPAPLSPRVLPVPVSSGPGRPAAASPPLCRAPASPGLRPRGPLSPRIPPMPAWAAASARLTEPDLGRQESASSLLIPPVQPSLGRQESAPSLLSPRPPVSSTFLQQPGLGRQESAPALLSPRPPVASTVLQQSELGRSDSACSLLPRSLSPLPSAPHVVVQTPDLGRQDSARMIPSPRPWFASPQKPGVGRQESVGSLLSPRPPVAGTCLHKPELGRQDSASLLLIRSLSPQSPVARTILQKPDLGLQPPQAQPPALPFLTEPELRLPPASASSAHATPGVPSPAGPQLSPCSGALLLLPAAALATGRSSGAPPPSARPWRPNGAAELDEAGMPRRHGLSPKSNGSTASPSSTRASSTTREPSPAFTPPCGSFYPGARVLAPTPSASSASIRLKRSDAARDLPPSRADVPLVGCVRPSAQLPQSSRFF